jgi:hypothetical protein
MAVLFDLRAIRATQQKEAEVATGAKLQPLKTLRQLGKPFK